MKRFLCLLSTLIIVFSLFGCARKNTAQNGRVNTIDKEYGTKLGANNTPRSDLSVAPGATQIYTDEKSTTAAYKDGTYTAHGDKTPYGNQAATVTISGGKIVGVSFLSVDNNNDNYSSAINTTDSQRGDTVNNSVGGTAQGNSILSRTSQDNSDIRKQLADAVIQNQTYNVNVSSNSPETVNNWKLAVRRALEQSQK